MSKPDPLTYTNTSHESASVFKVPQGETGKKSAARHCCVPNCTNDSRYGTGLNLSFHSFPKDQKLRKIWILKIRRDEGPNFQITGCTVVCAAHFLPSDFKWTPVRKTLKPGAIPSVFQWSQANKQRRVLQRMQKPSPLEHISHSSNKSENDSDCMKKQSTNTTELQARIKELEEELKKKELENKQLREKNSKIEKFGLSRFGDDDETIKYFTGFQSCPQLYAFFNFVRPTAASMRSVYYVPSDTVTLAGRKRCMPLIDEMFLFLMRIRLGLFEKFLSIMFDCSLATVSRKLINWANYLYFILGAIPLWLPKSTIKSKLPSSFKHAYPNTRIIIDCTEIYTQFPSSLVLSSQMYSNYKSTHTFKSLIGIAPHGHVTFISQLYSGCMSDVEITKLCGLLELLEVGDEVMADKGFTIMSILADKGVLLNIPPFLHHGRFTQDEIEKTQEIAKVRIHVERAIRRVKEFHIYDSPIPLSLTGSINQIWTITCVLSNFRGPLIAKK